MSTSTFGPISRRPPHAPRRTPRGLAATEPTSTGRGDEAPVQVQLPGLESDAPENRTEERAR